MNEVLHTKWGKAKLYTENGNDGYYIIISKKEGYGGKPLHRLIYENVYGPIPKGQVIHHKNGNKTDNCILNLEAMDAETHSSLHHKGSNNHWYGVTGENNINYDRKHSSKSKLKTSRTMSKTGIYRVYKSKTTNVKQGFVYNYSYYDENKHRRTLSSVNLLKLKEKVVEKGLPWIIIDKEKAKNIIEAIHGSKN